MCASANGSSAINGTQSYKNKIMTKVRECTQISKKSSGKKEIINLIYWCGVVWQRTHVAWYGMLTILYKSSQHARCLTVGISGAGVRQKRYRISGASMLISE